MNQRVLIAYAWRVCFTIAAGPVALLAIVLITRLCAWATGFEPIGRDGLPTEAMMLAAVFGWMAAFVGWAVVAYALFFGEGAADRAAILYEAEMKHAEEVIYRTHHQPRPGPDNPKPPVGGSGVRGPPS